MLLILRSILPAEEAGVAFCLTFIRLGLECFAHLKQRVPCLIGLAGSGELAAEN